MSGPPNDPMTATPAADGPVWRDRGAIIAQQQTRIAELEAELAALRGRVTAIQGAVRNSLTAMAERWEGEADYGDEIGHRKAAHATRLCAVALRHALSEGGCCDACDGDGYTFGGEPCWDCRGTGHPHPEDDLRAALAVPPAEDTTPAAQHAEDGYSSREEYERISRELRTAEVVPYAGDPSADEEGGPWSVYVGPRLATSPYDAARYRLGEIETPMGWRLGDVIARLVLDSGAVRPAPVADPSGDTEGGQA